MRTTTISCAICERAFSLITNSHLKFHGISLNQYRAQFPDAPTQSEQLQNKRSEIAKVSNIPRRGIPRPDAVKKKISKNRKGKPAWNRGIPATEESKINQSKIMKEKFSGGEIIHWNKGRKTSGHTKDKISKTLLAKNFTMSPESIVKRNFTMEKKKKEGWIHPSCHAAQKEKMRNKMLEQRYNPDLLEKLKDPNWLYKQHIELKKPLLIICKETGVKDTSTLAKWLQYHNIDQQYWFSTSYGERELFSFVESLVGEQNVKCNDRNIIKPKELDVYIPSRKLAIEYCGTMWHSEYFLDNYYHQNKWNECHKIGIRLLTIFEDEWFGKKDLVKSKLTNILGLDKKRIYARKCTITSVDKYSRAVFFNKNHLQGNCNSSLSYGLALEGELVALISFTRTPKHYILDRYASSTRVVGGFSRLLAHFKKEHAPSKIVTFADLRWSNGDLYEKTGFVLDKMLAPDYKYVINGVRHHKFGFRHKSLERKLASYDPSKTERENMLVAKIPRIWDCGKKRYIL